MIIYVDIDETICNTPEDRNYGKPMYDLFICDKAINSERFFNEET